MKRIVVLCCVMVLASAIPALAQKALAEALARSAAGTFRNLVESAEKMPEADYGFQATKETRTFAGFVGHTINSAFAGCARAKGEANPNKEDFEKASGKAALVKAITASNEYCAGVYAAANDKWMMETVTQGQGATARQVPRAAVLAQNTSHANEHYGNLVTYMRLNGLVPPSTERAQTPRPTPQP